MRYDMMLEPLVDAGYIATPRVHETRHIFNQYNILAKNRNMLREFLQGKGIGCEIYYPVPMHLQECFSYLGYKKGDFPVAEECAEKSLALPIYPELTDAQAEYVVEMVKLFYS